MPFQAVRIVSLGNDENGSSVAEVGPDPWIVSPNWGPPKLGPSRSDMAGVEFEAPTPACHLTPFAELNEENNQAATRFCKIGVLTR